MSRVEMPSHFQQEGVGSGFGSGEQGGTQMHPMPGLAKTTTGRQRQTPRSATADGGCPSRTRHDGALRILNQRVRGRGLPGLKRQASTGLRGGGGVGSVLSELTSTGSRHLMLSTHRLNRAVSPSRAAVCSGVHTIAPAALPPQTHRFMGAGARRLQLCHAPKSSPRVKPTV